LPFEPVHIVLFNVNGCKTRGYGFSGREIIGSLTLDALEEVVRFHLQAHDYLLNQMIETALSE